ncbi:MAG: DUF2391 family protein [Candidatus Zixiibacteriota bacterium]|nr:MAG: DUF2391 family protein [candidate division Zixibacteria bacterium]
MNRERSSPWQREVNDFVRAFSGAFIFGIPLLFSMEMWWIGVYGDLWKLLLFLLLAFGINLNLAVFTGFKRESSFPLALALPVTAAFSPLR